MGVPKHHKTSSAVRRRRSHHRLHMPSLVVCQNCKKKKLPHTVCPHCGSKK